MKKANLTTGTQFSSSGTQTLRRVPIREGGNGTGLAKPAVAQGRYGSCQMFWAGIVFRMIVRTMRIRLNNTQ